MDKGARADKVGGWTKVQELIKWEGGRRCKSCLKQASASLCRPWRAFQPLGFPPPQLFTFIVVIAIVIDITIVVIVVVIIKHTPFLPCLRVCTSSLGGENSVSLIPDQLSLQRPQINMTRQKQSSEDTLHLWQSTSQTILYKGHKST